MSLRGGQRGEEIGIISCSEGLYTKKKINHLNQLMPKGNVVWRRNTFKGVFFKNKIQETLVP